MRILVLTRYGRLGASSRIRTLQYAEHFRGAGIDLSISPITTDEMLSTYYATGKRSLLATGRSMLRRLRVLLSVREYDLLWIEKELFPFLPDWAERWLSRRGIRYVVDYDDAVFHYYETHPRRFVRFAYSNKIAEVMRLSSGVVAGNAYLAEYATRVGASRVEYIPSVIDDERYSVVSEKRTGGELRIGWIGSPATAKFLRQLSSVWPYLLKAGCKFRLVVVGGSAPPDDIPVEVHRWSEETEVAHIQSFDVGVMPLDDGLFERGKCGFKLIQYMACGLPVIATPIGANRTIVEHGRSGFHASTAEEWANSILHLYEGSEIRRTMGAVGRARVEQEFSIRATAPRLISFLKRSAGLEDNSLLEPRSSAVTSF